MKKGIIFAMALAALVECAHGAVLGYEGYIAAKAGEATLVFTNATIAVLADGEFSGRMGGAWVNGGNGLAAKGYNKEYRPGEGLRVQFQCIEGDGQKEYVKCVRVVFTDSPAGVCAVCDYMGFVTLGYKNNALGYDFRDDANWKAVAASDGAGYGMAAICVDGVKTGGDDAAEAAAASPWSADYDEARGRAKAAGRDLLVLFTGSDWCVWCKKLENEVLSKQAFLDYATNEFVCVALDFPNDESLVSAKQRRRNAELKEKFEAMGFPTIVVVGADDEAVKFMAGYERGGAEKWVADFKKDLRLAPLREKYFREISRESTALQEANIKALEELGNNYDTNTAVRVKAHMAKWADDMRGVVAKLLALDLPDELGDDRKAIVAGLESRIRALDKIAGMDTAELINAASSEDGEGDEDGGDDAEEPLKLPIEGAGTAIDLMEKVHLPFCERLFVQPEIAMLGDNAAGVDMAPLIREWARSHAIRDINKTTPFKDYAADATKAWQADARTPFVAIMHLAMGKTGLDAQGIAAERRKVWETWKDDPRWSLASRIQYVAIWKSWNPELTNELNRISIDLKKKFIISDEWKPEELDRARWVLSLQRSNNKQLFEELRTEGVAFDPWLEAASLAQWHIDKAWAERGDGFASTVTEEGWAGYKEHREKAIDWAEKAFALRPDLSAPCTVGLTAFYGNPPEALKWYGRAAAVCKDDLHAATKLAWGFRPRWGGSTRMMMDFFMKFLTDDFGGTIMPAWAIDHIYWGVFKEETYRGPERNFEEWAEENADTIRRFSDLYMNGEYLKRDGVSMQTRDFVRDVFVTAAWSMGDMELFKAWREYAGASPEKLPKTYLKALTSTTKWRNAGMRALADWVGAQPESERAELLRALRHAFGQWEPMRADCRDHTHETRNYEPFARLILPRIYSGAITKDNTPGLQWGFLRYLAGSCLGTMALERDGHDFTGVLPKNVWGDIYERIAEMVVEFEVSVDSPETKGEAMMHFDFGSSDKDFYQRFSVLTVANKIDEKDNRFAILPWPKGEKTKAVKIVFRGRDVEVYDNGSLAYKRQLRDGAQNVTKISFARSNNNSVPFKRIFIRAIPAPIR